MYSSDAGEDTFIAGPQRLELTTGDWIALRRLANRESLTKRQVERLVLLGLATGDETSIALTEHGRTMLAQRP